MWEQIRANKRNSALLMAIMASVLLGFGYALGSAVAPGAGWIGLAVAAGIWLITTLVSLCRDLGREEGEDLLLTSLPLQRDLASMAGTSRETMSRILARLESEGWLTKQGSDLVVHRFREFQRLIP